MSGPQGSTLGPILFSLYINDLPNVCQYPINADNAVLFTKANSDLEASEKLTSAMNCIDECLSKSCLLLHLQKTDIFKVPNSKVMFKCISVRSFRLCRRLPWTQNFNFRFFFYVNFNIHNFRQI